MIYMSPALKLYGVAVRKPVPSLLKSCAIPLVPDLPPVAPQTLKLTSGLVILQFKFPLF
jgi:hypothetical protein